MFDFYILITGIVLLSIDFVYLNLFKGYFKNQVEKVQLSPFKFNVYGAALCYMFLTIGLYYFIIKPHKTVQDAFLLGLVIYGIFETTNYGLFTNWSILTVFIDTLWGGLLFGFTTYIINKLKSVF